MKNENDKRRSITKGALELIELTLRALVSWMTLNHLIFLDPKGQDDNPADPSAVDGDEQFGAMDLNTDDDDEDGSFTRQFVQDIMNKVKKLNSCDWSRIESGRISSDSRQSSIGKPLKIRGTIHSKSDVMPCYLIGDGMDMLVLEIKDDSGETMQSCPLTDPNLLNKVQDLFESHHSFDFYGTILPARSDKLTAKKPVYKFLLIDIEASENPLQIVGATKKEIREATQLAARLAKQPGGILSYLKTKLIEIIGIKGLDESPKLERSLEFMIRQALSDGYDASRSISHRLHSMVIGSPAVGKKLLTEAARILNPVYTEAHPGRISVPGIAGAAVKKKEMWTSDPGMIPLAHRGVFVIQDFHHVKKKDELMGVLSMVMEDGRIINATAGRKTHNALTSIHIDLNRHSHIYLDGEGELPGEVNRLDDIGVSMNVLTRFDFITEIPRDTKRQMEIALEMHTGAQESKQFPEKRRHADAERKLQVLVAFLRSEYAEVQIPAQLSEGYIRRKQEELIDVNREHLSKLLLLGDYQTRLSNSIDKLVFAIARGNARIVATEADVDEAFKFVSTKMNFLRTIEDFEVPSDWNAVQPQEKVINRRAFIREAFKGMETTVNEVHKLVQEKYDMKASTTTIRRDLIEIGQPVRHGVYLIGGGPNGKTGELAKCA